jgi:hypothetical protein
MSPPARARPRRPHWPSLEEQLAQARAVPGSALEKLIRDNQDFDLLLPEEAHDRLPFPPWLRVWWRRKHPELEFSGPPVGYPLILERVLEWMLTHQDLPAADGQWVAELHSRR